MLCGGEIGWDAFPSGKIGDISLFNRFGGVKGL